MEKAYFMAVSAGRYSEAYSYYAQGVQAVLAQRGGVVWLKQQADKD